MFVAFFAGGLVTLWSSSTTKEDRDIFGWSACGACVMTLILFTGAVMLRPNPGLSSYGTCVTGGELWPARADGTCYMEDAPK